MLGRGGTEGLGLVAVGRGTVGEVLAELGTTGVTDGVDTGATVELLLGPTPVAELDVFCAESAGAGDEGFPVNGVVVAGSFGSGSLQAIAKSAPSATRTMVRAERALVLLWSTMVSMGDANTSKAGWH